MNAASLARDEDFTFVTLMMALALAMRSHGRFHLHGAVVVLPSGRPVVIAGDSGRGKSTSTIALLEAGASWLCDDTFFVVGGEGDALTLHSMPRPFHVSPTTLDAFPRLRAHVTSELRPSGKYDVSAASAWPGRGLAATNVAPWIVLPEVHADCATAVVSIDQAETLLDIMPASAWVVLDRLDHQTEHASLLRRLVSGAVGFRASLGRDMLERPERLLEALVAAAPLPATSRR